MKWRTQASTKGEAEFASPQTQRVGLHKAVKWIQQPRYLVSYVYTVNSLNVRNKSRCSSWQLQTPHAETIEFGRTLLRLLAPFSRKTAGLDACYLLDHALCAASNPSFIKLNRYFCLSRSMFRLSYLSALRRMDLDQGYRSVAQEITNNSGCGSVLSGFIPESSAKAAMRALR